MTKPMPDLPLVSIITPSYNQGAFLEATLRSVLAQDYPHIEYIVMDGGSTDESATLLQRYAPQLAYWESQPDRGQAHAINKGLQRARGEILGWLNSDDVFIPDTVSRTVKIFASDPTVDVVYGRLERIDSAGRPIPTPILPKDRLDFGLEYVIGECIVNQPGCFWRRQIMEEVGLLDERWAYALDHEYWIRMALAGARFHRLAETVALFRLSTGSKTVGQTAAQAGEQLQLLDELLAMPGLAQRLGLSQVQVDRLARRTRAQIGLRIFYGSLKLRQWGQAGCWLGRVLRSDPAVIFERRWLDLALARIRRSR
jgi:glycosyltransferase involved in cell wall biosynthesis